MTQRVRLEHVVSFVLGAVVGFALNRVTGWWLDSGGGVSSMLAAVFVVAFFVAKWKGVERRERAISLWMGALVGMAIFLFLSGPGTIWPLVLGVAALVTAAPILLGVAVATMTEWVS